jgi:transposase-like protein
MTGKPKKYSIELKVKVVELYLSGTSNLEQLCKEYEISGKRILREWIRKYKAGELTENQQASDQWYWRKKFKNKEDEWEYLKLENEYLKKKLLSQGESEEFIANLWSSKNLK